MTTFTVSGVSNDGMLAIVGHYVNTPATPDAPSECIRYATEIYKVPWRHLWRIRMLLRRAGITRIVKR